MKFKEWDERRTDPEFASWSSEKIICDFRGGPNGPIEVEKLFCLKSFTSAREEGAPPHLDDCKGCVRGSDVDGEYREKFGKPPGPKARKRQPADVGAILKKIKEKEKEEGVKKFKCDKCGRTFGRPQTLGRHKKRCGGPEAEKPGAEKPKRKYVGKASAAAAGVKIVPGRPGDGVTVVMASAGVIIISNQPNGVKALMEAQSAIGDRLREELGV